MNRHLQGSLAVIAVLFGGATAQAGPVINDIGGATDTNSGIANGRVDMTVGNAYNGKLVVNDETGKYPWTIKGSGFGTTPGTVTLYGRTVPVISWSDKAIRVNVSGAQINPTRPWDWAPLSTTLRVRTAAGQIASTGVEIVPAIRTRIYGQCTYHVALRRLQMGRQPSPSAYGGYTTITASWVPARGDQLQWTTAFGKHTAIIESVGRPTMSNGVTTYSVTISQLNAAGDNQYTQVTTAFSFRGTTVLKAPKFSDNSSQATSYYR